jgi:uncharacterized membrane protein YedE/YeeE
MSIDWTHFSPGPALAGGALIGLAAGLLFLSTGRIAGISGILSGLIPPRRNDADWRVAFLSGLFVAPVAVGLLQAPAPPAFTADYGLLALAGLLVGFGTRLGGGCTSGHGVCGLSRLSFRSFVATAVFMVFAAATVFVYLHLLAAR